MNLSNVALKLTRPLKHDEFICLDEFFSNSSGNNADGMNTSQAHGVLTATLCGPDLVLPSEWMPVVLGCVSEFRSLKQGREIIHLIMRMYKSISIMLRSNGRFEPLFVTRRRNNNTMQEVEPEVDAWCQGFLKGMALRGTLWRAHDHSDLKELLLPILALGAQNGDVADETRVILGNGPLRRELASWIPDAVTAIYTLWRKQQADVARNPAIAASYAGLYIKSSSLKRTAQMSKTLH